LSSGERLFGLDARAGRLEMLAALPDVETGAWAGHQGGAEQGGVAWDGRAACLSSERQPVAAQVFQTCFSNGVAIMASRRFEPHEKISGCFLLVDFERADDHIRMNFRLLWLQKTITCWRT